MAADEPAVAKIFGIGFGRTGTRSLARYLQSASYNTIHWPSIVDGVNYETRIAAFIGDGARVVEELMPVLDRYDAFTDVPFPGLYRELADLYPDARFILTTRNLENWWRSVARHWGLAWGPYQLEPYLQIQYRRYLPGKTVARLADKALFIEAHEQHIQTAKADLAGRSLLCLDLDDPRLNANIAAFLGVSSIGFPHVRESFVPRALLSKTRMLWRKNFG